VNFTGPKVKKSRALGIALTPKAQKYLEKRPYPPGQHGQRRRRRPSGYGIQLLEKQRLRFQYNVGERHLRKLLAWATLGKGRTGETLLQLLETRLDAMVLRAGFARTIYQARQMVSHGHIEVNGQRVSIPSRRLKPADKFSVRAASRRIAAFSQNAGQAPPPYVTVDADTWTATLEYTPPRTEIPVLCQEQLIVEFYSR
jgi:small subunit ribosomal protein S4